MENTIRKTAEFFNKKYFDSELPISCITFHISNKMFTTRGHFVRKRNGTAHITISSLLLDNPKEWKRTLIHELIHYWQNICTNTGVHHGKSFTHKAKLIFNKSNGKYNITRTASASKELQDKISNIRATRNSNSIIYTVLYKDNYNFLRNLTKQEIKYLKSFGIKVFIYTGNLQVRCNKNVNAYLSTKYTFLKSKIHHLIENNLKEI